MRSSAAGSTFSEYYGVNGNIGRAIMIIASLATVLLGLNKLVQIIGYISPVLLLEQGYEVHITYRRSAGKAEDLMAANPGRLFAHKLDQGKIEEIENADFLQRPRTPVDLQEDGARAAGQDRKDQADLHLLRGRRHRRGRALRRDAGQKRLRGCL